MNFSKVFLGGTKAGADYRQEIIPLLSAEYFNPVVKDWNEAAQEKEKEEKDICGISLYVLTPFMEGVFSVAEIVEDFITRRVDRTVCCILKEYQGKVFTKEQQNSLDALTDMLTKYSDGKNILSSLEESAKVINALAKERPTSSYIVKNRWVCLKKLHAPTEDYTYSHEERCDGKIVAVLPFVPDSAGMDPRVIARKEFTPPWGLDRLHLSSITGGVDKGEEPIQSAARELLEETGISMPVETFIPLGTVRGSKSSDSTYYLFAVDVTTGLDSFQKKTGEDANEKLAENVSINPHSENLEIQDTILHSLIYRWERKSDVTSMDTFQW
jgi:8-oxo-dGTP pyrophosphatase MutT (NUDIX family)